MRTFQKLRNKGFSLIELIVTVAILSVVGGAVAAVMVTSQRTYNSGSAETDLQYEAQLVSNQLQDLIIDTAIGISYEYTDISDGSTDGLITSDSKIDENANINTKQLWIYDTKNFYRILWDQSASKIYYNEYDYGVENNFNADLTDDNLLAEYVTGFSVDLSNVETNRTVSYSITLTKPSTGREYTTTHKIKLRNEALINSTLEEIMDEIDDIADSVVQADYITVSPEKIYAWPGETTTDENRVNATVNTASNSGLLPAQSVVWYYSANDGTNETELPDSGDDNVIKRASTGYLTLGTVEKLSSISEITIYAKQGALNSSSSADNGNRGVSVSTVYVRKLTGIELDTTTGGTGVASSGSTDATGASSDGTYTASLLSYSSASTASETAVASATGTDGTTSATKLTANKTSLTPGESYTISAILSGKNLKNDDGTSDLTAKDLDAKVTFSAYNDKNQNKTQDEGEEITDYSALLSGDFTNTSDEKVSEGTTLCLGASFTVATTIDSTYTNPVLCITFSAKDNVSETYEFPITIVVSSLTRINLTEQQKDSSTNTYSTKSIDNMTLNAGTTGYRIRVSEFVGSNLIYNNTTKDTWTISDSDDDSTRESIINAMGGLTVSVTAGNDLLDNISCNNTLGEITFDVRSNVTGSVTITFTSNTYKDVSDNYISTSVSFTVGNELIRNALYSLDILTSQLSDKCFYQEDWDNDGIYNTKSKITVYLKTYAYDLQGNKKYRGTVDGITNSTIVTVENYGNFIGSETYTENSNTYYIAGKNDWFKIYYNGKDARDIKIKLESVTGNYGNSVGVPYSVSYIEKYGNGVWQGLAGVEICIKAENNSYSETTEWIDVPIEPTTFVYSGSTDSGITWSEWTDGSNALMLQAETPKKNNNSYNYRPYSIANNGSQSFTVRYKLTTGYDCSEDALKILTSRYAVTVGGVDAKIDGYNYLHWNGSSNVNYYKISDLQTNLTDENGEKYGQFTISLSYELLEYASKNGGQIELLYEGNPYGIDYSENNVNYLGNYEEMRGCPGSQIIIYVPQSNIDLTYYTRTDYYYNGTWSRSEYSNGYYNSSLCETLSNSPEYSMYCPPASKLSGNEGYIYPEDGNVEERFWYITENGTKKMTYQKLESGDYVNKWITDTDSPAWMTYDESTGKWRYTEYKTVTYNW